MEDPPPSSYSREMRNSAGSAFSTSMFDNLAVLITKQVSLEHKDQKLTWQ